MYNGDLALNNLHSLISHKPEKTKMSITAHLQTSAH